MRFVSKRYSFSVSFCETDSMQNYIYFVFLRSTILNVEDAKEKSVYTLDVLLENLEQKNEENWNNHKNCAANTTTSFCSMWFVRKLAAC